MFKKRFSIFFLVVFTISTFGFVGCSDKKEDVVGPAPFPTDAVVFMDEFGSTVTFQAFAGSKLDAVQIDQITTYEGSQGLVITVPDEGDPSGSYAGGAFTADVARDLTGYNAVTFWAKASRTVTLNVAGVGNDNTGTSVYTAEVNDLAVTTSWQKFIVPIPLSAKMVAEQGLFYFAEGPEEGAGCQIWVDEIIFENLPTITNPRAALDTQPIDVEIGDTVHVADGIVTFSVEGTDLGVSAMPGYFTYTSTNTGIVSVGTDGVLLAVGVGTAALSAKLGTINATGTTTVNVTGAQSVPTTPAPAPTQDPSDVISVFSDAYTNVPVDRWTTEWDDTEVQDITIGADNVKKYFNLSFAAMEFTNPTVDASDMTYFHMDIWTPNTTAAPAAFKIKLVDFGADSLAGTGDDVEHELTFDENSSPSLASESWVSIDLPLAAFSGLVTKAHLAQIIISGDLPTVYIDNIYFYNGGLPTGPAVAAPTPTKDAGSVVSLFSDAYTSTPVDTWSAVWDNADVADFVVGADSSKKYTNLPFAVIDFRNNAVDASAMTHFHMDVWTPEATASPAVLKIKLIDFGSDGVYGNGDDVEHELEFDESVMNSFMWIGIDVPLTDLSGLTTKEHIYQMVISGSISTVFVDNIYFYDSGIPTVPPVPAPVPALPAADVISLYSDAYTDVPVDTWSTGWDSANVADYVIGSDSVKKYTNLLFAGIEFINPTIDASAMTHFHMDLWTPDATNAPAIFKIKLVDFGANGAWDDGGVDDVEHEITLDESVMNSNTWVSIDVPLTDFVDLITKGHLAQMIISGTPNTVYVDNVYLHK